MAIVKIIDFHVPLEFKCVYQSVYLEKLLVCKVAKLGLYEHTFYRSFRFTTEDANILPLAKIKSKSRFLSYLVISNKNDSTEKFLFFFIDTGFLFLLRIISYCEQLITMLEVYHQTRSQRGSC